MAMIRENNMKFKKFSMEDPAVLCHHKLLENNLPVAEIIEEIKVEGCIIKKSVWVEGNTFAEVEPTAIDWEQFGIFFADMNNLGITAYDLVHRNILRRLDGRVIICDLAKLYFSDFPEEPIIKYLLNNIYLLEEYKQAFLKGYLTKRPISKESLLEKECQLNYDGYQDLYYNGELIRKGIRSNKRLSMVKDDFENKNVLDLGCSMGMFCREAKRKGAFKVFGVDNIVRGKIRHLIDLPAYISYLEGLAIQYQCADIEHPNLKKRVIDTKWDIIFFCAMLGHISGDREAYVKWLKSITKIIYFESNLGGTEEKMMSFIDKIGFAKVECLGESGDPDRYPNNHYIMWRCEC